MTDPKIIHGSHFSEDLIKEAIAIDKLYYSNEDLVSFEICKQWQKQNPDIYSGIIDDKSGALLGYINLMPVSQEVLNSLMLPDYHDIQLAADQIQKYHPEKNYLTYLASMARIPSHECFIQKDKSSPTLMNQLFWAKIEDLKAKGITVSSSWAKAVTPAGAKFAMRLGMNQMDSSIWRLNIK